MLDLLGHARIGLSVLKLVKDPLKTEEIFKISDIALKLADRSGIDQVVDRFFLNPEMRQMWNEKYDPELPPLKELLQYPQDSLGYHYAKHMQKYGFTPDFYPLAVGHSKQEYLQNRLRKIHDIFHTITGYDASVEGELALQGFVFAQNGDGMAALIVAIGIFHYLRSKPTEVSICFDKISEAYQRGKAARPLFAVRWEERWRDPIEKIRAELNIVTDNTIIAVSA